MSQHETIKWSRKIRRNWLVAVSIILLCASAYFIVKTEQRRAVTMDTNSTDANSTTDTNATD